MIKNIEPCVRGAYNGSRAHQENASVKKGEYSLSVRQTTPPLSYLKINFPTILNSYCTHSAVSM